MNLLSFNVLLTIRVLVFINGFNCDEKIELQPKEKPFPGLKMGTIDDIIPKPKRRRRIINGNYADNQELPYQVGLLINYGNITAYTWCGGALIRNEWIITSAHCTSGSKTIEIRLGSIYKDRPLYTVWGFENHVHKGWISNFEDIALVKIKWVNYTSNIAPASLPSSNGVHSEYVNSEVIASGWGDTNDGGQKTNRLQYLLTIVIDKKECAEDIGPIGETPSMLCTKTQDIGSTCFDDSGGPLVLKNSSTLIGIVSFAYDSCTSGLPNIFTRITYYLDWIHQVCSIPYEKL